MVWKHFFWGKGDENYNENPSTKIPINLQKKKTNLPANYPAEIKEFSISVKSELLGTESKKVKPNLTIDEREALEELINLQKSGDIVLQPADKGSGICILHRKDYISEAQGQLNDTLVCEDGSTRKYYEKVNQDKIKEQFNQIKEVLNEGVEKNYITKEFAKLMLPTKPKPGTLYILPKVHKPYDSIPKGRPFVTGSGSNTELICWFCDQAVKDAVKAKESFIEDTPDILRFFDEINEEENLPQNTKPVALDLKSMYSNIPTDEGLAAFKEELDKREDQSIPSEFYIKLLRLVLEANIFEFNREYFIQLLGTAMGTRVAPTYANLFMSKLEKFMLDNFSQDLK